MGDITLKNAFVPFFTTKPEGRGTGIGLASVYGIAKQNRGFVKLDSEAGRGTTVQVYLPRYRGDERVAAVDEPAAAVPARGHETVLLVEDNEQVRQVTAGFSHSWDTTYWRPEGRPRPSPCAKTYDESIHLLLTDVVMPETTGIELAERIRVLQPGIATLFVSGYADHLASDIGAPGSTIQYLAKPFEQTTLPAAIRKALGTRSTASG